MASSLAAMTARRAANFARLSPSISSAVRPSSLISRRGLAGAADHHGPPKVNCWSKPSDPANWKEEHFVIVSLTGWGVLIFGGYKLFAGGKKEEKLVEAAQ
ncbi:hypothetical protein ABFS82_08G111100 [Erythranthe guttata]|uniref:Uncharacterized protein n=1 Tax=Erythranthe guttata TaxID=4155 RepID=A0A022QBR1_ERYGU|nr:PREDICTED: uncharacterized protein LOC105970607 [Erythranthe guttata]EYU26107.1 hypothetical protein MIMGU_mgv1a016943mg [Erythranthe guttata]|eukprot:XP_012850891.1 PREDICTED: uncharacterized protein LOC105970607 [Erythranthe guttata]